ncbi:MAG: tetratricopeptide repeat protein [Pseudomonadota bacterium]
MGYISRNTYIVFILSLLTSACANKAVQTSDAQQQTPVAPVETIAKVPEKPPQPLIELNHDDRADLYYSILLASIADARAVYDVARDNYLKAAQITGHPIYARNAVLASERMRDFESSLMAAELWQESSPDDLKAIEVTTIGYLRQNDEEQALNQLLKLIKKNETNTNERNYQEFMRIVRAARSPMMLSLLQKTSEQHPDKAYLWLLLSQVSLFYQDLPLANQAVNKALNKDPNFISAIKQQSHLLYKSGRFEEAEKSLTQKLESNPDNREILIGLARLLYDMKEYRTAAKHLENAIRLQDSDLEARYLLAICLHSLREYETSLLQFMFVARYNYQADPSWFYIGDIQEQREEWAQARQAYSAVNTGSYRISAEIRLSELDAKEGKFDDSEKRLTNLVQTYPKFGQDIQLSRIEILNEYQGFEQALQLIEKLVIEYPLSTQYRFKKLWLFLKNKKIDQAWAYSQAWLTEKKQLEEKQDFILTAAAYFRQMEYPEYALKILDDGLSMSPNNKEFLYSRALYSEAIKDYDAVIGYLRQLLKLEPEDPDAMNALGYTLIDLNRDLEEAEKLVYAAYEAMPTSAAVIDSIGWLYYRKGDYSKAIKYLKRATKLDKSGEIYAHLAAAMVKIGQRKEAIQLLKDFLIIYPNDKKAQQKLDELEPTQP